MELFNRKNNVAVIAGDPRKAVIFLFWPLLLTFMVVAVNTYLDSFWVAQLGVDATSAVNAMTDIYGCIAAVGAGMGVACAAAISFHLGDNNIKRAESLAAHSIIISLILSLILGILFYYLIDPFIELLELHDVREMCYEYIMPLIWCNAALLVNGALCGVLRAEGATFRTTIASFLTMGSIVLNPLFIIELNMGVAGASWGTVVSTFISTAYLVYVFKTKKNSINVSFRGFKPDLQVIKELLFISVPYGVQNSLRKLAGVVDKGIIMFIVGSTMGTAAIAVFSLPWTYVRVMECLGLAFGAALIPVASYNMGKRDRAKADAAIKFTAKISMTVSLGLSVLIFFFAGPLMWILTTDQSFEENEELMTQILMILAFVCPLYTIRDVAFNFLQTMRKNNLCVIITFGQTILKLYLMYIGGVMFGPLHMVIFNVIGQYIGGLFTCILAQYYWRKMDLNKLEVTKRQERVIKTLHEMNANIEKEKEKTTKV